jgi:hypothetical protein
MPALFLRDAPLDPIGKTSTAGDLACAMSWLAPPSLVFFGANGQYSAARLT